MDYCLITTTIKVPVFFKEYAKKLKNKSKIGFMVVGDKKTPHKKVSSFMNENSKAYQKLSLTTLLQEEI